MLTPSGSSGSKALPYVVPIATWGSVIRLRIPPRFRKTICSLDIRFEDFVFIDYGSGKGRALLLASEFPFKRIIGVEFSETLHEIARANIATYKSSTQRCRSIESVWMDAAEYDLPDDPLVLYFYNPFLEPLMQDVVDRVQASIASRPRPVYAVLAGDRPLAPIFSNAGFVRLGRPDDSPTQGIFVAGVT